MISMIIFLPIKIRQTGGSSTFAQKLRAGLEQLGHSVIFQWSNEYDALLVNAQCPLRYLAHAKIYRKPIVQRLDGVYYPMTVAGKKYRLANWPMKFIYRYLADQVIFQSNYSRRCAELFFGGSKKDKAKVIYNAVNAEIFKPQGATVNLRDNPGQKVFVTASRFRRSDQILPLLESYRIYREKYEKNVKLIIIGNFCHPFQPNPGDNFKAWGIKIPKNVQFLGSVNNDQLPVYLRSADAFLFTHLNPPCPNNVLEAMACGLPIVGVADGAMPEICLNGQNAELIPADGDAFWKPRNFHHELFAANMAKITANRQRYSTKSREIALARFQLETMVEKYMDVFETLTQKSKCQNPNNKSMSNGNCSVF